MPFTPLRYLVRNQLTRLMVSVFPSAEKKIRFRSYHMPLELASTPLEPELFILPLLIPDKGTFLDIGANRGEYLFTTEQLRPDVSMTGFEPIPELARALTRLFPHATICRTALSDRPGEASFKIPYLHGRPMPTRGTLETAYREPGEETMKTFPVKLDTLDNWCHETNTIPGLIKIDVEGHEWSVLRGAARILTEAAPVLMVEIEQRHHPETPVWESIRTFKEQYQYQVFFFSPRTGRMEELTTPDQITQNLEDHKTRSYINNFFFLPAATARQQVEMLTNHIQKKKA